MSANEIYGRLRDSILSYNTDLARKAAQQAVVAKIPPNEAISALTKAIREVGEKFANSEVFLIHLMMAADAMDAGISVILSKAPRAEVARTGSVVIGTAKGDIHDIGKNIVIAMLRAEGFEVYDLGKDVAPSRFAEDAEKFHPDIVAVSALMTSSKPIMAEVLEYFKVVGIRDKYKIMVGGAPVTQEYAEEIGADGYASDAVEASKLARRLVTKH